MTKITQGAFNGGILSAGLYARADVEKFQKGLKDAVNVQLRAQGGAFNRSGLAATAGIDVSGATAPQFLIPFTFSTEQTYQIEFTDSVFRIIKDGAYVLDGSVAAASVTAVTAAAAAALTLTDSGRVADFPVGSLVFFQDPNGTHKLHESVLRVRSAAGADITFEVFNKATVDTTVGSWGAVGAGATILLVYQQAHPYALGDMPAVRFIQDADVMYMTHRGYPVHKIGRVAEDDWLSTPVAFGISVTGLVTGVSAVASPASGSTVYYYKVSPITIDDEEGLPSAAANCTNNLLIAGNKNTISWTAHAEAVRYNVYKKDAGGYGYIGSTTELSFADQNITADLSHSTVTDRNPFAAPGGYPGIVSFFEQRVVYGSTLDDPQLVEMSRVSAIENFSSAYPSLPDDALRFRLRAKQMNRLVSFIPHKAFTIMTSAAEWELAAQGDGDYLRPDKRQLSPVSYYGSHDLEPILMGSVALYVEPSGNSVRDYRLGDRSTPPGDITIMCRDLFKNRVIVSWAYAQAPYHAVWVVFADGGVLTLTYIAEHDVWGWTRHEFAGEDVFVHQVSVTKEDRIDVPYFVISRTIDGDTVTMTERQLPREDTAVELCYFVDGGLRVDAGVKVSEISGLLHLRGQTVTALLDGDVFENLVVDNTGTVDFGDRTARYISIGLPYAALIETLGVQLEIKGLGSSEGRYKSISQVAVRFESSRGLEAGTSLSRMNFLKEWNAALIGGPIPLRTAIENIGVEGDWMEEATFFVRQRNPLPMTINGVTPDTEFGE